MIKYNILFIFISAVLFLGLSSPAFLTGRLDPVPDELKVAHSSHCAGCHGFDATGRAMVDATGKDVNIFDDWQFSMMGLSAHDPFWRATLSHETSIYHNAKNQIESACLKCHAPLASFQAHLTGIDYSFEQMLHDSLGLDGVSCSACHQQPAKDLGKGHSGNFLMDTNRLMFGPYPNPFQGPMQIYVGFDPVFSDHIYSSGVCAGCHTLITKTLDENGSPTGNSFIEQATYHEWLNSIYPAQGKECQTCHMPFIKDSVIIATDLLALKKRYPYGLHQFFGANTAMLTMMKEHRHQLGLLINSPDSLWDSSIHANRTSLHNAGNIAISNIQILNDTLYADILVSNKAGHKLPSGYPSRIAWLQIILTNSLTGDTLYSNGLMDVNGEINGRDFPFEPHHEISYSSDDVQIYEMVMADQHGLLTTRLNGASHPLKDNRLLPLGFSSTHVVYDTVAIFGSANEDVDYTTQSQKGIDIVNYRIPLRGAKGITKLEASLNYHTFPSRWMQDLFTGDTLEFVSSFKSMYTGYENFTEIIDSIQIDHIDLTVSTDYRDLLDENLIIFPNPGSGSDIVIQYGSVPAHLLKFKLIDLRGMVVMQGKVLSKISLPKEITSGLYYFIFYKDEKIFCIRPYTVL